MSRSYLFIPGNTPSMIQHLDVFDSDAVIIDLEDSVVHYDKDAARILIQNFIEKYPNDEVDLYVRINEVHSPYFKDDVSYLDNLHINGYVLPKALPSSITELCKLTSKPIIPIIESPLAVLRAEEMVQHNQVQGLLLGAEDLTKEMSIDRTKEGIEIDYTRSHLSMVCHAYGKEAIDTPWTHKDDIDGLLNDTIFAKQLGFTAKSSIHPNHVAIINTVFTPSERDIVEAKRIVQKAESSKKGAFSLDGKMIDLPIIEKAKKLLEKAKKYNAL